MSRQISAVLSSILIHAMAVLSILAMSVSLSPLHQPLRIDLSHLETGSLFTGNGQKDKREDDKPCLKQSIGNPERARRAEKPVQEHPTPTSVTPDQVSDQISETGTREPTELAGQVLQAAGGTPLAEGAGSPSTSEPGAESAGNDGSASYLAEHFAYIRDLIQKNITYPSMARRLGLQGRMVLTFVILSDGGIKDVRVTQRSGSSLLDASAIEAVRRASPFPRPPVEAEIIIPVAYSLR